MLAPLLRVNASDLTPGWRGSEPILNPLKGNPRFDRLLRTGASHPS